MTFFGSPEHVPTCRIYPLQFRKIWKKLILLEFAATPDGRKLWRSIFLSLLTVGGLYVAIGFLTPQSTTAEWLAFLAPLFSMTAAVVFAAIGYEWLYTWTYFYDVEESFLRIRKGVLIRQEITIPYGRMQDVYVEQDVLDHLFHLYDLWVSTAAEAPRMPSHIDGLNRRNAEKIRELILERLERANAARQNGGV